MPERVKLTEEFVDSLIPPLIGEKWVGDVMKDCAAGIVYVTAFLDKKSSQKFIGDIAWETEVWIAEFPDHLIHFNGDRSLGPHA